MISIPLISAVLCRAWRVFGWEAVSEFWKGFHCPTSIANHSRRALKSTKTILTFRRSTLKFNGSRGNLHVSLLECKSTKRKALIDTLA
jgi:hypothetical protein